MIVLLDGIPYCDAQLAPNTAATERDWCLSVSKPIFRSEPPVELELEDEGARISVVLKKGSASAQDLQIVVTVSA